MPFPESKWQPLLVFPWVALSTHDKLAEVGKELLQHFLVLDRTSALSQYPHHSPETLTPVPLPSPLSQNTHHCPDLPLPTGGSQQTEVVSSSFHGFGRGSRPWPITTIIYMGHRGANRTTHSNNDTIHTYAYTSYPMACTQRIRARCLHRNFMLNKLYAKYRAMETAHPPTALCEYATVPHVHGLTLLHCEEYRPAISRLLEHLSDFRKELHTV